MNQLLNYIRLNPILALKAELFDKQLDIINSSHNKKCAVTSRRAGKSFMVSRYLTIVALKTSKSKCLYITDTRDHAKKLIWSELLNINKLYDLKAEINNTELTMTLPNGSMIWLAGVSDETAKERLRGFYFDLVCIDEAGSINEDIIRPLIKEIIGPALRDRDGTILLTGTPNESCTGYFHDMATDTEPNTYEKFHWTVLDNPKFPAWEGEKDWRTKAKESMEQWRIEECYQPDDPGYLREYKGLWVTDKAGRILIIDDKKNLVEEVPKYPWSHKVLGIDLGYHDEAGYCVVGYDTQDQLAFEIESFSQGNLPLLDVLNIATDLINKYRIEAVVVDPASGGNHLVAELTRRYDFPCLAADKRQKASHYKILRNDLRRAQVLLLSNSELQKQMKSLIWNKDYTREKEGIKCDISDSFLYAYMICQHWWYEANPINLSIEEQQMENHIRMIQRKKSLTNDAFAIMSDLYNMEDSIISQFDDSHFNNINNNSTFFDTLYD